MTDFIRFKEHYKQQGGRCYECAQPFTFSIASFNFRTGAFHCLSCQEAELNEVVIPYEFQVADYGLPN